LPAVDAGQGFSMTVAEPFVLSRSIAWPHFGHNLAAVTVNSGHLQ